jgi:uncharacterized protein
MTGWFELSRTKDNQFRFVLKAANSEIVLTSEMYPTKASAENGIASVRANCRTDARYELKNSKNGKYYFNLKAANHEIIGSSEMYDSEKGRDTGIASMKANGATMTVKDMTMAVEDAA